MTMTITKTETFDRKKGISQLTPREIYNAACLAELAYVEDVDIIAHECRSMGLAFIGYYRGEADTEFAIARDPVRNLLLVFIPGTESWRDVVTDIRATRVKTRISAAAAPPRYAWLHKGGAAAARRVMGTVSNTMRMYPGDELLLTGHSLGGLIARNCRGLLPIEHPFDTAGRLIHAITFGAPRGGCRRWAAYLNGRDGYDLRVEHAFDPVPYVPGAITSLLPRRFSRYVHAGAALCLPCHDRGIDAHRMSAYLHSARAYAIC